MDEAQELFDGICLRGMCIGFPKDPSGYVRTKDCPLFHKATCIGCKTYIEEHPEIHEELKEYIREQDRARLAKVHNHG